MLEIAEGIFLFFGVPLLMFIGAQWDPFWSLNEDGEPNRLGMFFVLVPYWILLFFWWKYREKSREYAGDIGILTSPLFSDDEKELVRKKYTPITAETDWSSNQKGVTELFKDNPGLSEEMARRKVNNSKRNGNKISE